MEKERCRIWLYWFGGLVMVALIVWGYMAPSVATPADQGSYLELKRGWSQVVDDQRIPLADIQQFQPMPAEESLQFECVLPWIEPGMVLLFQTYYQEVHCWVDGVLVQEFVTPEGFSQLKTPGSAWNQVDLTSHMSGKTLLLQLDGASSRYQNVVPSLYFVENVDVDNVRFPLLVAHGLITLEVLILFVITIISAYIWKNQERRVFFFALAQLFAWMLIWRLARLGVLDLIWGRPVLSYLMESFFLRLIPVGLWRLVINSTGRYAHPGITRGLGVLVAVNAVVPWCLQLFCGISLLELVWMQWATMVVLCVVFSVILLEKVYHFQMLDPSEYPCLPLLLLFFGWMAEMVVRWINVEASVWWGVCSGLSCVVYTVVVYILFARQDANVMVEKQALEQSYQRLQIISMMQQIKAHFIFNALNTLSALCKEAPAKADKGIVIFAKYLRSYMFLTNQEGLVNSSDELALVQAYLTMETMRFGEAVTFEVDTGFRAFQLPPLTIQPLVENAVMHGVRGQMKAGKVKVSVQRVGVEIHITVEDNGVGFDIAVVRETPGLDNVRERLRALSNGTLEVESTPGKGTKAVVKIPM